jgi:hypothetical protein
MANHPNRNQSLARWADVRSTSIEIARVIKDAARNRAGDGLDIETAMQDLWEAPTPDELALVTAAAFEQTDEDVLHWGAETIRRPAAT